MPPITAVSPLFTEICVTTFLVSIDGTWKPSPRFTSWPTESLRTSTTMMMRPSAVICGVTSRRSTAFLNCTVAGWFALPGVTYGISVPCSIAAFWLSPVTTRGLDTTLPRASASSADSSRLIRLPLPRLMSVSAS